MASVIHHLLFISYYTRHNKLLLCWCNLLVLLPIRTGFLSRMDLILIACSIFFPKITYESAFLHLTDLQIANTYFFRNVPYHLYLKLNQIFTKALNMHSIKFELTYSVNIKWSPNVSSMALPT